MYSLIKPTPQLIKKHLHEQSQKNFSYPDVGATDHVHTVPKSYNVDHNRIKLGVGSHTFELAKAALRRWEMFNLGWVELFWPDAPLEVGSTVGMLVRVFGIYSLNACRIVHLIEEQGHIERFGFAYGTLADHAERGEERFLLEWHHDDDSVWYDILAFSQPNQFLSKVGYFYIRHLQKQFASDSKQAMLRAVQHQNLRVQNG